MNRILLIASSNIKKKKGTMVVIGILISLATILLYASISVLTNIDGVLQDSYKASNLADVEFALDNDYLPTLQELLEKEDSITDTEISPALIERSGIYSATEDGQTSELAMLFQPVDCNPSITKITDSFDLERFPENGIILCQYQSASGEFKVGDDFYLHCKNGIYHFIVEGFSEDANLATPLNMSCQRYFIHPSMFRKLADEEALHEVVDYKLKLKDYTLGNEFEKRITSGLYGEYPELMNSDFLSLNWQNMIAGVKVIPSIAMAIILAFSLILIIVVLSIIYYSIKNFIDEDLPNIGILKASGYTSFELSLSIIFTLMIVALLTVLIGLVIAILSTPFLGNLVAAMMGLRWTVTFDARALILAALIILATILLIVALLGRRYKKIFVLDALRGGIETHYFKRNHLALEKSPFSLVTSLGLKNILFERRKNIVLTIIIAGLTFASCAGLFMYEHFGKDDESLIRFSGLEVSDIIVSSSDIRYGEFDPTSIKGIKYARYGGGADVTLSTKDKSELANCDYWEDATDLRYDNLIEGRFPETEKEIVLSHKMKKALEVNVGDIVYMECAGQRVDYMVVGIDQKINHYGCKTLVSIDGFKRLIKDVKPYSVYLDLEQGYSYEDVKDILQKEYPNASMAESQNLVATMISGLKMVMKIICLFFLITTLAIVFLILFMLGQSRIVEQKKNLGISKALGFTTRQLIRQNLVNITPTVLIGCILGIVVVLIGSNPLISLIMSSFGVGHCDYYQIPLQYLGITLLILADALLVTALTSARIRKIEPIKMIRE